MHLEIKEYIFTALHIAGEIPDLQHEINEYPAGIVARLNNNVRALSYF